MKEYSKENPRYKDPSLFNIVVSEKVSIKGNVHQVLTKNNKVPNKKHWDSFSEKDLEFGRTKGREISEENRSRTKAIKNLAVNIGKDAGHTNRQLHQELHVSLSYVEHCHRIPQFAVSSSLYTTNCGVFINQDKLRLIIAYIKTGRHTMTDVQLAALDQLFTSITIDGKNIWQHIDPEGLCFEDVSERQSKKSKDDDRGWEVKETKILDSSLTPGFSAQVEINL